MFFYVLIGERDDKWAFIGITIFNSISASVVIIMDTFMAVRKCGCSKAQRVSTRQVHLMILTFVIKVFTAFAFLDFCF